MSLDEDGKRNAEEKQKERKELLSDVRLDELAHRIWKQSQVAQRRLNQRTMVYQSNGIAKEYGALNARDRAKVAADFISNVTGIQEYRKAYIQWAVENPGQHMKLQVAIMPKEIEVDVNANMGVIVLPAKMGSVREWEQAAIGNTVDGEVTETASPKEVWDNILEEEE